MARHDNEIPERYFIYTAQLTPPEALNLASKLLQFATQMKDTK